MAMGLHGARGCGFHWDQEVGANLVSGTGCTSGAGMGEVARNEKNRSKAS